MQRGRATHAVLWTLAVIVGVAVVVAGYIVWAPRATDFAGGKQVALADYNREIPPVFPPS